MQVKWRIILVSLTAVFFGIVCLLPSLALSRIQSKASSLGANIVAEGSYYTFSGVAANNLKITFPKSPKDEIKIREMTVDLSGVTLEGVEVSIFGNWQGKVGLLKGGSNDGASSKKKRITVKDADISWVGAFDPEDRIQVRQGNFERKNGLDFQIQKIQAILHNKIIEVGKIEKKSNKFSIETLEITKFNGDSSKSEESVQTNLFEKLRELLQKMDGKELNIQHSEIHLPRSDLSIRQLTGDSVSITTNLPKLSIVTKSGFILDGDTAFRWNGLNVNSQIGADDINGDLKVQDVSVLFSPLSQTQVKIGSASVRGKFNKKYDIDASLEVGKLETKISFEGNPKKLVVDIPAMDCQELIDSIPPSLIPKIPEVKSKGTFEAELNAILAEKPTVKLKLKNRCQIDPSSIPYELNLKNLKKTFQHMVYGPLGDVSFMEMGPGTKEWIPFDRMSPFLESAVRTTEDPGFRVSNGFSTVAFENSIRDDIVAGRFFRGASTVSMQLAKNLWLTREKTLSRKIQEAILTTYLEQNLTKDEILEYYFNIVEFGPYVYGIGPAAKRYFNTDPSSLRLSQALYLVSLLPNPQHTNADNNGHVSDRYMKYLHSLMALMKERGTITDQEYRVGITEWVVIGSPTPERKAPDSTNMDVSAGLKAEDWEN